MKFVVQMYNGFNQSAGWIPVMICESGESAETWINEEVIRDSKKDYRGLHYRYTECKTLKRPIK